MHRLSMGLGSDVVAVPSGSGLSRFEPASSAASRPVQRTARRESIQLTIQSDVRDKYISRSSCSFTVPLEGELKSKQTLSFRVVDWHIPDAQWTIESRETCIPMTFGWSVYPGARRWSVRTPGGYNIAQAPLAFNEILEISKDAGTMDVFFCCRLPVGSRLRHTIRAWYDNGSRVQLIGLPGVAHMDLLAENVRTLGSDYDLAPTSLPGRVADSLAIAPVARMNDPGDTNFASYEDHPPCCRFVVVGDTAATLAAQLWPGVALQDARQIAWNTAGLPLGYMHFHPLSSYACVADALSVCGQHTGVRCTYDAATNMFGFAPTLGSLDGAFEVEARLTRALGWTGAPGVSSVAAKHPILDPRIGFRLLPTRERDEQRLVAHMAWSADGAWFGPTGVAPDGAEGSWTVTLQQGSGISFAVRMPNGRYLPSAVASLLEQRIHEAWPTSWIRVWPVVLASAGWVVGFSFRSFATEQDAADARPDTYDTRTSPADSFESAGAVFGLRFDLETTTIDARLLGFEQRAYTGRAAYLPADAWGLEAAESGMAGSARNPVPSPAARSAWIDSGQRYAVARKLPLAQTGWGFLTQWPTRIGVHIDEDTHRLTFSYVGLPTIENCVAMPGLCNVDARVLVVQSTVQISPPPGTRCLIQSPFESGSVPGSVSMQRFKLAMDACLAVRNALERLAEAATAGLPDVIASFTDETLREECSTRVAPQIRAAASVTRSLVHAINELVDAIQSAIRFNDRNGNALTIDEQTFFYNTSRSILSRIQALVVGASNAATRIFVNDEAPPTFWEVPTLRAHDPLRHLCLMFARWTDGDPEAYVPSSPPQTTDVYNQADHACMELQTISTLLYASAALSIAQGSSEEPLWGTVVPVTDTYVREDASFAFRYGASPCLANPLSGFVQRPGWQHTGPLDGAAHGSTTMRIVLLVDGDADDFERIVRASQLRISFVSSGSTLHIDTMNNFPMGWKPHRFGFDHGVFTSFGRTHLLAPHSIHTRPPPFVFLLVELNGAGTAAGAASLPRQLDAAGSVVGRWAGSVSEGVAEGTVPVAPAASILDAMTEMNASYQPSVAASDKGTIYAPRQRAVVARFVARVPVDAQDTVGAAARAARQIFQQDLLAAQKLDSITISLINPDMSDYQTHGATVSVTIVVDVESVALATASAS